MGTESSRSRTPKAGRHVKGSIAVILMMIATVLSTASAGAQDGAENSGFFAPVDGVGSSEAVAVVAALEARPTTRRVVLAAPRLQQLAGPSVTFNVAGRSLVFQTDRTEDKGSRWFGSDSAGGSAVIINTGTAIAGTISLADGSMYKISPAGPRLVAVVDVDASQFLPESEPLPGGGGILAADDAGAAADDGSVYTVIVAYTAAARVAGGGTAGMQALITLAETETNDAYRASGIATTMDVVHTYETSTVQQSTTSADLTGIATVGDGLYDEVHGLRDTHVADVVVLIGEYIETCGRGYLTSSAATAFSVTDRGCATGNYTFGHEIGHNFGAHHDLIASPGPSYNHGHIFGGNPSGTIWRTVMSYGSSCGNCPRIKRFSNPDVLFDGTPQGTATSPGADNARVHDERAFTVANFRSCSVPTNDDLANAGTLTGASDTDSGNSTCATAETGEFYHNGSIAGQATHSVWYEWTAPASGPATADTFGSAFDTVLGVYTGTTVGGLIVIGENDDVGGGLQSEVNFTAVAGTNYKIAVDGFNSGGFGAYTVNINQTPPTDLTPPTVTYPQPNVYVDQTSPVVVEGTITDDVTPVPGLILQAVIIDIGHAAATNIDPDTYRYFNPATGLWTDGSKTAPQFYGIPIQPDGSWSVSYDPADANGSVSLGLRAFDGSTNKWPADKSWQAIVVLHDPTKPTATADVPVIVGQGNNTIRFTGTMTDNESPIRKGKVIVAWQRNTQPTLYWNGTDWVIYNEEDPDIDILRQLTGLNSTLANQTNWEFEVPKPGDQGFVIAVVQPQNGSYQLATGVTTSIRLDLAGD